MPTKGVKRGSYNVKGNAETYQAPTSKTCLRCSKVLSLINFYRRAKNSPYYQSVCKGCYAANMADQRSGKAYARVYTRDRKTVLFKFTLA